MIYYNNSHVYLCVIVKDPVSYGQPVEHLVRVFIYFTENPLKITQIWQKIKMGGRGQLGQPLNLPMLRVFMAER